MEPTELGDTGARLLSPDMGTSCGSALPWLWMLLCRWDGPWGGHSWGFPWQAAEFEAVGLPGRAVMLQEQGAVLVLSSSCHSRDPVLWNSSSRAQGGRGAG